MYLNENWKLCQCMPADCRDGRIVTGCGGIKPLIRDSIGLGDPVRLPMIPCEIEFNIGGEKFGFLAQIYKGMIPHTNAA